MPTVTLKVSGADRELWVHAAETEGVSLSEWLRRAAKVRVESPGPWRVPAPLPDFGQPDTQPVITPEQAGNELIEAWEPIPAEVLDEIRREWNEGGDLAQDSDERLRTYEPPPVTPEMVERLGSAAAETKPPQERSGHAVAAEPNQLGQPRDEDLAQVGVGEEQTALPSTPEAQTAPTPTKEALQEQARELLADREFKGPDFKPEKKAKKKR